MLINKDTKIFCSFSSSPGNNGCTFFNAKFLENNIDAIYKSFYSDDIIKSINAVKTLKISGFAVSSPFKVEVIKHVDYIDEHVSNIGAANTIINDDGYLKAHNTDWIGILKYLMDLDPIEHLTILGNGGFSKAAQYVCKLENIPYKIINRENWDDISKLEGHVFNATPENVYTKGNLIDARPFTSQGKIIAKLQAEEQYKLYVK